MDPLDAIDSSRFDAEQIQDRLNQLDALDEAEREQYLADWDYAGLDEAGHPLSSLLGESHNATYVVRGLDGTLVLLWEELPSLTWHVGPLCQDHMPAGGDLADALAEAGLDLDPAVVLAAINALPIAPGPVRSF